MDSQFNYKASTLSEEELRNIIENREKFLPETVEASLAELQLRGVEFANEEVRVINDDIKAKRDNATIYKSGLNNTYKNSVVEDLAAPLFYSRRSVYIFTVLCGALFGSILFAINAAKIKNTAAVVWSLLFGLIFTTIQIIGIDYVNVGSSYGLLCGLLSAICLDYFFWKHFFGNTFYRARSIWVPLIVAVMFIALLVVAMLVDPS
jgi:hypothetical protein